MLQLVHRELRAETAAQREEIQQAENWTADAQIRSLQQTACLQNIWLYRLFMK